MFSLRNGMLVVACFLMIPAAGWAQGVAFEPVLNSFPNGVVFPVTPVVSADRRYVRLGMAPQFTVIEGFNTYSVPAAVSGGGAAGGFGGGGGLGVAGMNGPVGGFGMGSEGVFGSLDSTRYVGYAAGQQSPSAGSNDFEDHPQPRTQSASASRRPTAAAPATRRRGRSTKPRSAPALSGPAGPRSLAR